MKQAKNKYQSGHTSTPEIFTLIKEHKNEAAKEYFKTNPEDIHLKGWRSDTPLHIAAQFGNMEIVEFLVANGAAVNAQRTGVYATPLCWADTIDIARFLLDHGATTDDRELYYTTRLDKYDIVHLLLSRGAKINKSDLPYLMCKSVEAIKIYLKHGVDINGCDSNGSNLLHKFCWLDLPEVFDFAYANGVEWKKDNSQRTPYYVAKQGKRLKIIAHLADKHPRLIANKTERLNEKGFVFEKIAFLKKLKAENSFYIALTQEATLLKYEVSDENLLVLKMAIRIDVPIIRNFTFDKSNNIILPGGDCKLLVIDSTTFEHLDTIHFDSEIIFDQITYLPKRNIFIGSSSNWELLILDEKFNILYKGDAEDGTYYPLIHENEELICFLSYDQNTFYDLYKLESDLSINFVDSFFKIFDNPSVGFAFNKTNDMVVSYPDELECYEYKDKTLSKKWALSITNYPSQHGVSCLVFLSEHIFALGKGKRLIAFDSLKQKVIEEVSLDLKEEIRSISFDEDLKNLVIRTNEEIRLVSLVSFFRKLNI